MRVYTPSNAFSCCTLSFHVSAPYSNTDSTVPTKRCQLRSSLIFVFHTFFIPCSTLHARALLILRSCSVEAIQAMRYLMKSSSNLSCIPSIAARVVPLVINAMTLSLFGVNLQADLLALFVTCLSPLALSLSPPYQAGPPKKPWVQTLMDYLDFLIRPCVELSEVEAEGNKNKI